MDATASNLTMVGRTVILDAFTLLQDSSSASIQTFSLADIVNGDRLRVAGLDDGQAINAIRVGRVEIVHCCNWDVYDSFGGFLGGGNDPKNRS